MSFTSIVNGTPSNDPASVAIGYGRIAHRTDPWRVGCGPTLQHHGHGNGEGTVGGPTGRDRTHAASPMVAACPAWNTGASQARLRVTYQTRLPCEICP